MGCYLKSSASFCYLLQFKTLRLKKLCFSRADYNFFILALFSRSTVHVYAYAREERSFLLQIKRAPAASFGHNRIKNGVLWKHSTPFYALCKLNCIKVEKLCFSPTNYNFLFYRRFLPPTYDIRLSVGER